VGRTIVEEHAQDNQSANTMAY
ncbi:hypothetical protein LCGC14_2801510, partial [marine sediment metagenome]